MRMPRAMVVSAAAVTACVLLGGCGGGSSGGAAAGSRATPTASHGWRDTTYRLTCDGLDHAGFDAKLLHGSAHVMADVSDTPYYLSFDVTLEAAATGDVDGDGKPDTVVLLQCLPQPSNGFVQEVQVFRADGSLLAELPSPRTLQGTADLAPLYDPAGLSVDHEDVVAAMKQYGPSDSHATGPTVPLTVRWHWNGKAFVRVP